MNKQKQASENNENFTQASPTRFEKLVATWNFYREEVCADAEDAKACFLSYLLSCVAALLLLVTIVMYVCCKALYN